LVSRMHPYNLIVTNVPGPQVPLYLLGAQVIDGYPLVPLFEHQCLGVAVFSYIGKVCIGVNADWDRVPDLHRFIDALRLSFDELRKSAEGPIPLPSAPVARAVRVLVVTDDPELRCRVRNLLEETDASLCVITARDALEALPLVDVIRPDVVIADLSASDGGGDALCRRVRAERRTASVPLVWLRSGDGGGRAASLLREGIDESLVQPFHADDLIASVGRVLQRASGTPWPSTAARREPDRVAAGNAA